MDDTAVQNADDLIALFSDENRLKEYDFNEAISAKFHKGNAAEEFHTELPFEEIGAIVQEEKALIFSNLKGSPAPQFEHVGSTSIKGMPGMLLPDGLLMEENFPPSKGTIQALLDSGWKFSHVMSHVCLQDVWFCKRLGKKPLEGAPMVIHVTSCCNKFAHGMIRLRDLCNSDQGAFEDYKQTKVNAAQKDTSILQYKIGKGKCQTLNKLQEEIDNES